MDGEMVGSLSWRVVQALYGIMLLYLMGLGPVVGFVPCN